MKKYFLFLVISIFIVSFVSAGGLIKICVDKTPPSAPSNLAVISSGTNIVLTWGASTDEPSCSGIDYYNISRDGDWIGTVAGDVLNYSDLSVPYGTYSYSVFAVDLVGHNSGPAIKNDVILSPPSNGGSGGTNVGDGGEGSSYICVEEWECGNWGECIEEKQTRVCTDVSYCGTTLLKPNEFRACFVYVPKEMPSTTSKSFFTGAVTGIGQFASSTGGVATLVGIIILASGIFIISRKKK